MQLTPAQSKIASDSHRFRVVNCGRRFGKTTLAVWEMLAVAIAKEDAKVAYISPTFQTCRDIAWAELKGISKEIALDINETRLEVRVSNKFGGTSLMIMRGWESIETLRGQRFDFLVLDEVASYRNFMLNWQEVIRPTLTDMRGEAIFISTPKGFNHFYDLYNMSHKDDDFISYHFTTYDNPFIPKDEIEKARKELTSDRFAQEYLADFRKTEGLVYKEFIRENHITEPFTNYVKRFAGVDFGFTNPSAVLTILKDGNGRYFVSEEWYKRGKTDSAVADYVAAQQFEEVYADPESASGCQELQMRGVNTRDVIKNRDSVRNGINAVRELFKANRLFIDPSCVNLIMELETYSYPEKKADHNEEENPIKENDHALDALRYALMMESTGRGSGQTSIYIHNYAID